MNPTSARSSNVWSTIGLALLLILAALLAYANSFSGAFVFDDSQILDTPQIHHLFPLSNVVTNTNRPLLNLSLALNYELDGINVTGYHIFNILVHLIAGLFLFGALRLTFRSPRVRDYFRDRAEFLAFTITLLWLLHPLQTASVTYVIQRTEAMMGMFYLAAMFSAAQYFSTPARRIWIILATGCIVLGLASKEVMITAPIVILFYDRIFWSESFRNIWQRRKLFYSALFLTWLVPVWLLSTSNQYQNSVGFGIKTATPLEYALTQPEVILHYLRLAFIPVGLCLDYQWPIATHVVQILPNAAALLLLLGLTIWAFIKNRPAAFAGIWFFFILSITSSFFPIQDIAFEHRMYLPLASVIALAVIFADFLLNRYCPSQRNRRLLASVLAILFAGTFATLTHLRNRDFQSEETMWRDILAKRPSNIRAYNDLGLALVKQGKNDEAMTYFKKAMEINPRFIVLYNNIGLLLLNSGDLEQATQFFTQAVTYKPDYAEAVNNLGLAYARAGRYDAARTQYENAIKLDPSYAESYNNLGVIYLEQKQYKEGWEYVQKAIALKPHYATAYNNLGVISIHLGKFPEAEQYFRRALQLNPDYAKALNNLGVAVKQQGRVQEAMSYFSMALKLSPNYREAQVNLEETGRMLRR